ncbi:MAG: thioredoxin family protein, partial [Candidatus Helarchaeota archaeon]
MNQPDDKNDSELERIRQAKLKNMMNKLKHPTDSTEPTEDSGGTVINLDTSRFWTTIKENNRVLVDCYADWCAPCRQLGPIFTQLAKTHRDIVFGRINIDTSPTIASTFQVHAIPLILFFKQGNVMYKLTGLRPYNTIEALIQRYLS